MLIEITSFGHKYGQPEADIMLDMRCLENPYWVPALRELSGLECPCGSIFYGIRTARHIYRTC